MTSLFAGSRPSLRRRGLALTQVMALCYFTSMEICGGGVYSLKLTLRRRGGEGPGGYTWGDERIEIPDHPTERKSSLGLGQAVSSGAELGAATPAHIPSISSVRIRKDIESPAFDFEKGYDLRRLSEDNRKHMQNYFGLRSLVHQDRMNRALLTELSSSSAVAENSINNILKAKADEITINQHLERMHEDSKAIQHLENLLSGEEKNNANFQALRRTMYAQIDGKSFGPKCVLPPAEHDEAPGQLLEQYVKMDEEEKLTDFAQACCLVTSGCAADSCDVCCSCMIAFACLCE